MDLLIGLAAVLSLSLFLAQRLGRSASLMPLVVISGGMLWFSLMGCFGLLRAAGWLWYGAALAAAVWLVFWAPVTLKKLVTPGFVLFAALGAVAIILFFAAQPMLTEWDEFTVWGTAAKVVKQNNALYTQQPGNLLAIAAPPGLAVYSYMMQFFGLGFAEYKLLAGLAVLYLAAFAAADALWDANRPMAGVWMGTLVLLPFLFEGGVPGVMSQAYLVCMADMPMAALFGGALCLYFAGGKKDAGLLVPVAVVLAALVNIKDMGLAFACVAAMAILADLLFCAQREERVLGIRRRRGALAAVALLYGAIGAAYGGWLLNLKLAAGIDRTDLGTQGKSFGMLEMLTSGAKALLGIQPDAVFDDRAGKMLAALGERRVWLLGSGARMLALILALAVATWLLAGKGRWRRRVLVFTAAMALGFVAYYIFMTFNYTYIFQEIEATVLTGYTRYIYPYWFAWLLGQMCLLGHVAERKPQAAQLRTAKKDGKALMKLERPGMRRFLAGALAALVCVVLAGTVALRANWRANVLRVSPSLYGQRLDVRSRVDDAVDLGMRPEDEVYLISQGDDAGRFYMFAYEMRAHLVPMYAGEQRPQGNTSASLMAPGEPLGAYAGGTGVWCTQEQLLGYLKTNDCTHILLDNIDGYILQLLRPLASDGLRGWDDEGVYVDGVRYYRIVWQPDDGCRLEPEGRGTA